MADTAIRAVGGADAPLSYRVPGSAIIRIKQIHVKYADNGAATDWLPSVRIVDDAGHTMGTAADQGVLVTAGDDADVSFFPGVKHAAIGPPGPPGTAAAQVAFIERTGIVTTVLAGATDNTPFTAFSASAFSYFTTSPTNVYTNSNLPGDEFLIIAPPSPAFIVVAAFTSWRSAGIKHFSALDGNVQRTSDIRTLNSYSDQDTTSDGSNFYLTQTLSGYVAGGVTTGYLRLLQVNEDVNPWTYDQAYINVGLWLLDHTLAVVY